MIVNYRKISKWVIASAIIILALIDVWLYLYGENATFSVVITDWSLYSPWMPFAFGFLMGHFFAPAKGSAHKNLGVE